MSLDPSATTPTIPAAIPPAVSPPLVDGELLRVEDVKVWFPIKDGIVFGRHVGDVRAVDGVSFAMRRGETLGLVGESGCGKTTIGRTIIRLYKPTTGRILFDGVDIAGLEGSKLKGMRRRMQMVFQDPYASLNPRMNVGRRRRRAPGDPRHRVRCGSTRARPRVAGDGGPQPGLRGSLPARVLRRTAPAHRRGPCPRPPARPDRRRRADQRPRRVDPGPDHQPARATASANSGLTYLFVAHDLSVVAHISDRIAVMYLGRIVELTTSKELMRRPLHPYSVALLSAIPVPDPVIEGRRRRIILKGDVPSPVAPPSGCRFHTRCWLRERLGNPETCQTDDPDAAGALDRPRGGLPLRRGGRRVLANRSRRPGERRVPPRIAPTGDDRRRCRGHPTDRAARAESARSADRRRAARLGP